MFDQFFGKPFRVTFLLLAAMFLVSVLAFPFDAAQGIVLLAVAAGTAVVAWKRPELGLAIAFAELFANSHGHLVSYSIAGFPVSLRMAVFGAVMLAWIASVLAKRSRVSPFDQRLLPFIPLIAAVLVGFGVGFSQNSVIDAFKDGNSYLYLAYLLPILSVEWDAAKKRLLLQVFAAAAAWIAVLTLGLLYVFTHFPEWMLGPAYKFIRDTRTGELTKMAGNIFRIFLQAQFSVVALGFFLAPFLFVRKLAKRTFWQLVGTYAVIMSVILISLSRSFWVGMIAGGAAFVALAAYDAWPGARAAGKSVGAIGLATAFAAILLIGTVLFPLPYRVGRVGDLTGLFSERTTDLSDVAISSRWNLLPPLFDEIKASPVVGSGFGEPVTFKTDDPRARAINPDGTWTTYALEWGWLEVWLKMGILGPLAFAWLLAGLIRGFWPYLRTEQSWVAVAFLSSVVMLYATHVFSPYLNHPLGLGLLLLAVPFLKLKPPTGGSKVSVLDRIVVPAVQARTAPSMSE